MRMTAATLLRAASASSESGLAFPAPLGREAAGRRGGPPAAWAPPLAVAAWKSNPGKSPTTPNRIQRFTVRSVKITKADN